MNNNLRSATQVDSAKRIIMIKCFLVADNKYMGVDVFGSCSLFNVLNDNPRPDLRSNILCHPTLQRLASWII